MNKQDNNRESICALVDGQLTGEAFANAVDLVQCDADARRTWQSYHLVGDVLRSNDLARCRLGDGFVSRLQSRLQQEGVFQMPEAKPTTPKSASVPVPQSHAANDPVFRWKLVAGFASMVAVGAIGWSLIGAAGPVGGAQPVMALASTPSLQLPGQFQLSARPATSQASVDNTSSGVMIRDPHLDALLAAHKQFGNGSALQGSTGFLRNATFEGPAR
jgi:sigma-E factor negative regulatory protein RseA